MMTKMLASVTCLAEAQAVQRAGVDIIDLKDPAQGALGALPLATVGALVAALGQSATLSATIGDWPLAPGAIQGAAAAMAQTGVDYVKVGLGAGVEQAECVRALAPICTAGARVIIVLFADQQSDFALLPIIAGSGCAGVMLDTADKRSGGLLHWLPLARLREFVLYAREYKLLVGLAGALRAADVPVLLPFAPDYLGFRGALCAAQSRTAHIDPAAVATIRGLIPKRTGPSANV